MITSEEWNRKEHIFNECVQRALSLELIAHFMPNRHAFAVVIHNKTGKMMHLLNTLTEDWEPDPEIPQYIIEEFNRLWDAHLSEPRS